MVVPGWAVSYAALALSRALFSDAAPRTWRLTACPEATAVGALVRPLVGPATVAPGAPVQAARTTPATMDMSGRRRPEFTAAAPCAGPLRRSHSWPSRRRRLRHRPSAAAHRPPRRSSG